MRTRSTILLSAFVMFHESIVHLNVLNDKSDSYWYDSTVGAEKKRNNCRFHEFNIRIECDNRKRLEFLPNGAKDIMYHHQCERFATATFQHTSGHHVTIYSQMTLVGHWFHSTNLVTGAASFIKCASLTTTQPNFDFIRANTQKTLLQITK